MASRDLKGGGWEPHVAFLGGGELGGRGRLHRGGAVEGGGARDVEGYKAGWMIWVV
jgi:hypothetical protein